MTAGIGVKPAPDCNLCVYRDDTVHLMAIKDCMASQYHRAKPPRLSVVPLSMPESRVSALKRRLGEISGGPRNPESPGGNFAG